MSKQQPPRWSLKLLRSLLRDNYLEEIEGDLEEVYQENLESKSVKKARSLYNREVIKLIRPSLIRKLSGNRQLNYIGMLQHNFIVSFRSLRRTGLYTTINVLGLAVALTCCVHLLSFVADESSYDEFIPDGDKIHRLVLDRQYPNQQTTSRSVPHSLVQVMAESLPEIESATTYAGPFRQMLLSHVNDKNELQNFHEDVVAADSSFLSFFGLDMSLGNPNTALKEPRSMVITESVAAKYFGDKSPIGQTIRMSRDDFTITGVCNDLPINTHLKFDFLMSINTIDRFNEQNFTRPDVAGYFKLKQASDPDHLQGKLPELVENYMIAEANRTKGISWTDYKAAGNDFKFFLVPLPALYLHPDNLGGMKAGGNLQSNRVILIITAFIFLLACINFINLSTAKTTARIREISTKKILGSKRIQLVGQLLTETFLISLASLLLGLILISLSQPFFNDLSGKNLGLIFNFQVVYQFVATAILLTLVTGIYPAILLSRIKPIKGLSGQNSGGKHSQWIRNALVTLQFTVSVVLVVSMFVMRDQMSFILNKDLGYDKEQLMIVTGDFHMDPGFTNTFINELESMPEIASVAGSLSMPGLGIFWEEEYQLPNSTKPITMQSIKVGDHFPEALNLRLKKGQFFARDTWDSTSVILNQSAVDAFGLNEPIGKKVVQIAADGTSYPFKVVAVIDDFNFDDLYNEITPLIIKSNEVIYGRSSKIIARLNGSSDLKQTIQKVENKWTALKPSDPFNFTFSDDVVNSYYSKEQRLLSIFEIFSALSLFIACLGLFALSAYTISLKSKEIGIRKIIGANVGNILTLLGKPISMKVVLAILIATPLTWFGLENWWLNAFAYRVDINIWQIIGAGALILILAWLTIIFNTVKAATIAPIKYLRDE